MDKTAQVTLYQQVLYCGRHHEASPSIYCDTYRKDDSLSMKDGHRGENRCSAQNELINRIARVTTRTLSEGEGIYLRYINQGLPQSDSLKLDQIPNAIQSLQPFSDTPIGTN